MADEASSRDQPPTISVDAADAAAAPPAAGVVAGVAAAAAAAGGSGSAVGTPGPATGTVTPALSELPPEQVENSLRVSLADLCAKGTALYAHKNYEDAAAIFSQAAAMQSEMNGEMDPENAEILFLYGRSLFRVGQSQSEVLGGKAPEKKKEGGGGEKKSKGKGKAGASASRAAGEDTSKAQRVAEEGVAIIAAGTTAGQQEKAAIEAKKPLFQFTGDENWDDSDEEEVLSSCPTRTSRTVLTTGQ